MGHQILPTGFQLLIPQAPQFPSQCMITPSCTLDVLLTIQKGKNREMIPSVGEQAQHTALREMVCRSRVQTGARAHTHTGTHARTHTRWPLNAQMSVRW